MKKIRAKYYIAYGSNLNLEQMARRCPTAKVVGSTTLKNYRLMFRGGSHTAVATVERNQGDEVPVLIWRLQPKDEKALDVYEGWPHLYRKETLRVTVNGKRLYAMIYIMNEDRRPYGAPSPQYFLYHPYRLPERWLRPAGSAAGRDQVDGGTTETTVNP